MKPALFGFLMVSIHGVFTLSSGFCRGRSVFNPHPYDCSKYVICLAGKSFERICSFPIVYGSNRMCYLKHYGLCPGDDNKSNYRLTAKTIINISATTTTRTVPKPTPITYPRKHGTNSYTGSCRYKPKYSPHRADCKKYILCIYKYPVTKTCPFHLYFDSITNRCKPKSIGKCGTSLKQIKPSRVTSTTATTTLLSKYTSTRWRPTSTTYVAFSLPASQADTTKVSKKQSYSNSCDRGKCQLPNCWCTGTITPNNLPDYNTPKIILFSMDDNVNAVNFNLYSKLFDGKKNPNGCPVKATFFVSGDYNDYHLTRRLYDKGHEIAVHTLTHRTPTTFWASASYEELLHEIVGMKRKLESYGIKDIVGYRNPFLQTAGDRTFSVLKDHGFLYDSTLPANIENIWWPYTLEYNENRPCVINPCPDKSYPGLWEIPLLTQSDGSAMCSMFDGCHRYPSTEKGVYEFFKKNFDRHFKKSTAPFPMFGHAAWMTHAAYDYRKIGLVQFIEELYEREDVYFVSASQVIEWMKDPTPLQQIRTTTGPFSCA